MTIRKKFFMYLLLLVLVPLLLASGFIYNKAATIIGSKSSEAMLQSLKQTSLHLNEIFANTENLSYKILANADVQQLSNLTDQDSQYEINQRTNKINLLLSQELRVQPYIHSILIKKGKDIIYNYGPFNDYQDEGILREAIQKKGVPIWTSEHPLNSTTNPNSPQNVISLVRAVNDIELFQVTSVEIININAESIIGGDLTAQLSKKDDLYIINNQGQIISSTDKSKIGKPIDIELNSKQIWKNDDGYYKSKLGKKAETIFYDSLSQIDLHLIKVVPDAELNEQQSFLRSLIIAAIAICLIFGIVFSVILDYGIIKPIKKLKKDMDLVKRGNFNLEIRTRARDEIGQLSFYFRDTTLRVKDLIEKVYFSELKEKEAKLQMLSMQINPHFLYNTLESIRWSAMMHQENKIADQLEALSNMFRYSLSQGSPFTTIQQEVEHVNNYMLIQNFRFDSLYALKLQVDEDTLYCESPHFILQPLIENSIQHGFENMDEQGVIHVHIYKKENCIRISVEDNGLGTDEEFVRRLLASEGDESSFALRNINSRIRLKYGTEFGLALFSQSGKGTLIEISFPALDRRKMHTGDGL